MSDRHLDDDAIEEIVDGASDRTGHLEGCAPCQSRVARARAVWAQLLRAPAEAPVPPSAWPRIAAEMHAGHAAPRRLARGLAAAAAVVLVFGAGFAAGASRGRPERPPSRAASPSPVPAGSAAEIQRAGTEYVGALAAFASEDAAANRQAHDAALSALYGASTELARLAPGDPASTAVERALATSLPAHPVARASSVPVRF